MIECYIVMNCYVVRERYYEYVYNTCTVKMRCIL